MDDGQSDGDWSSRLYAVPHRQPPPNARRHLRHRAPLAHFPLHGRNYALTVSLAHPQLPGEGKRSHDTQRSSRPKHPRHAARVVVDWPLARKRVLRVLATDLYIAYGERRIIALLKSGFKVALLYRLSVRDRFDRISEIVSPQVPRSFRSRLLLRLVVRLRTGLLVEGGGGAHDAQRGIVCAVSNYAASTAT
ncbi:hypothetical protein [Nonomuraea sp. SYSU D8015]|uniref:hypothetical protein n=1 Tax=Nonomuraea sp. SYSU D8015 TaxID=2593644 RepID=UPI0016607CFF|nr:hypothetical protein [Nonomuraea sp. SYSU D8015]